MSVKFRDMNRITTIFLIATLLAHASLGCCLHHVHACQSKVAETSKVESQACLCHENQAVQGEEKRSEQVECVMSGRNEFRPLELLVSSETQLDWIHSPEPRPRQCDDGQCNLALIGPSSSVAFCKAQPSLVAFAPLTVVESTLGRTAFVQEPYGSGLVSSEQRLHLYLAILLI